MVTEATGCPRKRVYSEKRGLRVVLIFEELCYSMREYKKDTPVKKNKKEKSKNWGVYQGNLVSKKPKEKESFNKEVVHNIEFCWDNKQNKQISKEKYLFYLELGVLLVNLGYFQWSDSLVASFQWIKNKEESKKKKKKRNSETRQELSEMKKTGRDWVKEEGSLTVSSQEGRVVWSTVLVKRSVLEEKPLCPLHQKRRGQVQVDLWVQRRKVKRFSFFW